VLQCQRRKGTRKKRNGSLLSHSSIMNRRNRIVPTRNGKIRNLIPSHTRATGAATQGPAAMSSLMIGSVTLDVLLFREIVIVVAEMTTTTMITIPIVIMTVPMMAIVEKIVEMAMVEELIIMQQLCLAGDNQSW